jgi:hypothetical protein
MERSLVQAEFSKRRVDASINNLELSLEKVTCVKGGGRVVGGSS